MATAASCGSVTAPGLGLPLGVTVPAAKGDLPKRMFMGKSISSKLKQRFMQEIESIVMMAILRPQNTGLEATKRMGEILVLGLHVAPGVDVPVEVIDHIAAQRQGGIVFVCVRDGNGSDATDGSPSGGEQCALAVRRNVPVRAGHAPVTKVYASPWQDSARASLTISGSSMSELWDSLCAQVILGQVDGTNLDAKIAARNRRAALTSEYEKLSAAHARAKTTERRNEIYAKMHAIRKELDQYTD